MDLAPQFLMMQYTCLLVIVYLSHTPLHEAGLRALRFHDLRHGSATIPISMGVNSKVVQERLGHSTISITLGVYGHVTESMQRDAMQK